jgi:hypothetical protein
MPKSRVRRKTAFTPPPERKSRRASWVTRLAAPLMVGFFLVGLAWIVVFYVAGSGIGFMETLGNWNLIIGFGLLATGFGFATQWR